MMVVTCFKTLHRFLYNKKIYKKMNLNILNIVTVRVVNITLRIHMSNS